MARSPKSKAITGLTVQGYKSIPKEQYVELGPLTVLAGANSSGKSSMMQPLLLLKQTLESSFDPGPILLNGTNVRFSNTDQMLARQSGGVMRELSIGVHIESEVVRTSFRREPDSLLDVYETSLKKGIGFARVNIDEGFAGIPESLLDSPAKLVLEFAMRNLKSGASIRWSLSRDRCFRFAQAADSPYVRFAPGEKVVPSVRRVIHVPGLRGMPSRSYPATAIGDEFFGTFEHYTASVLHSWSREKDDRIANVGEELSRLGLTRLIAPNPISDTEIELNVGRLPAVSAGTSDDTVNIADVGVGVSQVLPVIVALYAAGHNQLVYIEQPELHLHPSAQLALAGVFASAIKRGVRVVIETHSSLLLLGLQTLVAEGSLDPKDIKLHWFQRNQNGQTEVNSVDVDEDGRFGSWPVDFGKIELEAQSAYLDAVDAKRIASTRK